MPLATLLTLIQIASGAGAAVWDFVQIQKAVEERGDSHLTLEETEQVKQLAAAHPHPAVQNWLAQMNQMEEESGA